MTDREGSLETSDPDARAREIEQSLTDDERFGLVIALMGQNSAFNPERDPRIPEGAGMCAGYTPGVPRLGIPALQMTDASMGVTNPGYAGREGDTATAMPACIALGSTFNPDLARASGAAIGREARSRGFNVQLAGGNNLMRDPRNGRNFEYFSEDPLHSAVMAAESVNGIQSQRVISTLKHFSLNCNEVNRHWLDAVIDPAAHRESDLLAFEIAIERSHPGAIMTSYNKVNGEYTGGNAALLHDLLKGDWGYPGWVMSDWGATPTWEFALRGQDQACGIQLDALFFEKEQFTGPLREAHAAGLLPQARLSDMVRRILRSVLAVRVDDWAEPAPVDLGEHNDVALETARQGIVLLKNEGLLPISNAPKLRIGVVGGYAHLGVLSGTGSGAVVPNGGYAAMIPSGGRGPMGASRNVFVTGPSPIEELSRLLPGVDIEFDPGQTVAEAVLLAQRSDLVIAFGVRVEGEGYDLADLSLPWGQDDVISAVATANPATIVVLETGNPVSMPWHDQVNAIVQPWYPGQAGAQAIAEILTGVVNPSGHLPITFPTGLDQVPRPHLPALGTPWGTPTTIEYHEGAEIGYRWFAQTGSTPRFPFGHGLSYTSFEYSDLVLTGDGALCAEFTITNTGDRAGTDVAQFYLIEAPGGPRQRLLGFERIALEAGEARRVSVVAERRTLARYDTAAAAWHIQGGTYRVAVGPSATDLPVRASVHHQEQTFGA